MRNFLSLIGCPLFLTPAAAQFLTPEWRGEAANEHAAWDIFTEASLAANLPDGAVDLPTEDARLTCTTSSAFLTSSGNIYSFQSASAFQIDDSADFPIKNVFLQISALGSEVDPDSVSLIATHGTGETSQYFPARNFVLDQRELEGEFGGVGTTYAFQWDIEETPVNGGYSILFAAAESSMSLDELALDTSGSYLEVPIPEPKLPDPTMQIADGMITLNWPQRYLLQTTDTFSNWDEVSETSTEGGLKKVTLPLSSEATFFRLKQASVN